MTYVYIYIYSYTYLICILMSQQGVAAPPGVHVPEQVLTQ